MDDPIDAEVKVKLKPIVLVATTCRWFPTARLAIALANAGCIVDVICPSRHPVGRTKIVRQIYGYHDLMPLSSFENAITAAKPDLIVPGDDLATRHLHELYYREKNQGRAGLLSELIEQSLGSPESFPVVYERASFITHAQEEGVRVPNTEAIADISELESWAARSGFPTVLKANGTSGGDGVRLVHTLDEAKHAFRSLQAPPLLARAIKRALIDQDKTLVWPSLLRRRSVVNAQAFVAGREATSAIACWKGTVLASLHFEVLNKAERAGHATVVRLIDNPEMSVAAEKMARRLNLSGLHGFDFMLESETEHAYLIEINPRATQVGHLTLGPGRDLPAALYAAVTGEMVQPAHKVTERDTITLFPQEWIRDPHSEFLRSGYHDVPWEEPELVRACIRSRREQSAWYSHQNWAHTVATARLPRP